MKRIGRESVKGSRRPGNPAAMADRAGRIRDHAAFVQRRGRRGKGGRLEDRQAKLWVAGLPMIERNSRRVFSSSRKEPSMRLVTSETPGFLTPRVVMH